MKTFSSMNQLRTIVKHVIHEQTSAMRKEKLFVYATETFLAGFADDFSFRLQTSSTFELEQALINMDGEILLGEEGQCPLCQKVFNRKTSLLNHIRNHSADKKYVCGYCQKGFSQQANLRNHERIHTNDRPYVW